MCLVYCCVASDVYSTQVAAGELRFCLVCLLGHICNASATARVILRWRNEDDEMSVSLVSLEETTKRD